MFIDPAPIEPILRKSFTFWDKLSEYEKKFLLNNVSDFRYTKWSQISGQSSSCAGVLLIQTGTLRVYMLSDEGKDLTLFRLNAGDVCILSASCVLKTIRFEVLIEAESDCRILVINVDAFSNLAQNNVWVENFSYKVAAERFSDVIEAIQKIFFLNLEKRLATFLREELRRHDGNVIPLTHEQIAKYIGSAREVVSRTLKIFSGFGIVELSRKGIKITDVKKLEDLTL